jgi:DNA-directed RNA polymerase subunit N (RpoN/RPB10)
MEFRIPFVRQYCTCTDEFGSPTLLAIRQKEYEILSSYEDPNFNDIMKQIGVTKICCRRNFMNLVYYFLNNNDQKRCEGKCTAVAVPITAKHPLPYE